jgi:hypothetical protein
MLNINNSTTLLSPNLWLLPMWSQGCDQACQDNNNNNNNFRLTVIYIHNFTESKSHVMLCYFYAIVPSRFNHLSLDENVVIVSLSHISCPKLWEPTAGARWFFRKKKKMLRFYFFFFAFTNERNEETKYWIKRKKKTTWKQFLCLCVWVVFVVFRPIGSLKSVLFTSSRGTHLRVMGYRKHDGMIEGRIKNGASMDATRREDDENQFTSMPTCIKLQVGFVKTRCSETSACSNFFDL